jgi:hypothetical protein
MKPAKALSAFAGRTPPAASRHAAPPRLRAGIKKRIKIYKIFILFQSNPIQSNSDRQKTRFPLQFASLRLQSPLQSLARLRQPTAVRQRLPAVAAPAKRNAYPRH